MQKPERSEVGAREVLAQIIWPTWELSKAVEWVREREAWGSRATVPLSIALYATQAAFAGEPLSAASVAGMPSTWAGLNINAKVRIKLTERGLQHLRQAHDARNAAYRGIAPFGDFKEPKVDSEGWHETQLWCVMQDLGPAIIMGCPVPFETTIQIEASAMKALFASPSDGDGNG